MYIPIDRETALYLPSIEGAPKHRPVVSIASNREKTFVAVATEDSIYIWLAHPQLLLCVLSVPEADLRERGNIRKLYWRYDSSAIAVLTSLNHIYIYRVDISEDSCYNLEDNSVYRRSSQELFLRGYRPAVGLFPAVIVNLSAPATCCVPLREELLVCVKNGYSHHITWEGAVKTEFTIRLASVPFAHDQLQSKPEYINDNSVHIVDAVYAPLIGGYCVVLSDGRAALLTSSDSKFHPNSLLGVWVANIKDALCTDVNHKFRLLLFGCENGEIAAFHLDDTNGSLVQAFRVPLNIVDGPELTRAPMPCTRVTVLPNGTAMAAVWGHQQTKEEEKKLPPTAAIFSAFGAQLWCSLEEVSELETSPSPVYTTVEWGTEGFQLWFGRSDGLRLLPLVRSAASCNPVMEHHDRVVLLTDSNIIISPPREREPAASAPHSVWLRITYPNEYISANWPIRFVSLDAEAKTLAIAGTRGLAHCNLTTGRWKIFGNESQERDIVVTGGVVIWESIVGIACSEQDNTKELLKFYPLSTKLDNRFASVMDTESRILAMNLRDDSLVTFDVDCRILLYKLIRTDNPQYADSYAQVRLERIAEIRVGDLIPHPACLVSLQLTHLNLDTGGGMFMSGIDTVLINVSGKLITLSPKNVSKDDEERFQLNQPIMVASFVEQMWHDRMRSASLIASEETPHLSNALWINCGSKGMRVWLPLLPGRKAQNAQESSFISKRIMLPYALGIYPIVIYSNDCLAVGVETIRMQLNLHGGKRLSFYNLHRNSEIFVHHLLRQLLKRNLGMFALEVAGACRRLPHFSHSLELLLHGVLEEEATSSEPIPDPLLPRCVAFIREFPEYLKTVAHCSRKTELALWPALFSVTGSPNDLFEVCLRDGQLHTAASFFIVLQSIEHSQISQEQSLRLLSEALSAGEWTIARDMVRFANSIDANDMDSPARSPIPLHQISRRTTSMSLNNGEANELVFSRFQAAAKVSKVRHSHDHKDTHRKDSTGSGGKKVTRAMSNETSPPSPTAVLNPLAEKMDVILTEHGQRLLDDYCIRDLGCFCAHLGIPAHRLMAYHSVSDFPLALTRLHSQFAWPYPVPGKHVVDQLEKRLGAMATSKSSCSLNGSFSGDVTKTPVVQPSQLKENGVPRPLTPTSEGDESCSIKEAKLLPLGADTSPPINGRVSPDSLLTQGTPGTPTTNTPGDWQGVDMLIGEATSKGPWLSQQQLSTMLQLFSDACSIDWVFLLCLVSRDIARIRKEINANTLKKWGPEAFGQTRLGCTTLLNWAASNCLGYVSILQVFHAHLEMVSEQTGCLDLPPQKPITSQERISSRKPEKMSPLDNTSSPQVRKAFRGRERSRSVDRLTSPPNAEESEGCIVM